MSFYYICLLVCLFCRRLWDCATLHLWRSEGDLQEELVFSFHNVGPKDGPQVVGFGSQGFFLLRSPPTAIAFKQGEREVYGESCLERRPGHGPQWALILMIACCTHQGLASARQAVCQGEFLLKCSPFFIFFSFHTNAYPEAHGSEQTRIFQVDWNPFLYSSGYLCKQ